MTRNHGSTPSGLSGVPRSRHTHGPFGRLFRNLDPLKHEPETLKALAETMRDERAAERPAQGWGVGPPLEDGGDNPAIPAGYTYFGQFVDHDITFDPASSLLRANDPDALHNFRTPRFDLDSLYGEGPDDEPFLYEASGSGRFLLGAGGRDLPRNEEGTALLGDPRNDENAIVGQLQHAFLRFHNRLIDQAADFEEAQRMTRWHYQWVVISDLLARIVPEDVLADLRDEDGRYSADELDFYAYSQTPFMPVEFSVAAYRFGHSMVRPTYDLNDEVIDKPIFLREGTRDGNEDLRGFRPLPEGFSIKWSNFVEIGGAPVIPSRVVDTRLAPSLFDLPFGGDLSLAERNLLRGQALELPSGESVARRMGVEPLSAEELNLADRDIQEPALSALQGRTPLWYYVLAEAEITQGGARLGMVGGRIVAETLVGLLAADPFSQLCVDPTWSPQREALVPIAEGELKLADILTFATGA